MHQLRRPLYILLTALALGILADHLFFARSLGVSAFVFVSAGLLVLRWLSHEEERSPARANLWLGASALFFAACLAWRATPLLVGLNVLAVFGLLLLLTASYRAEKLGDQSESTLLGRLLAAPLEIAFRPGPLAAHSVGQVRVEGAHLRRLVPVGRGLALATPAVAFFTVLLVSADSVFSSYVTQLLDIRLPFEFATVVGHGVWISFVAWVCAGGLLTALLSDEVSAAGTAFGNMLRWGAGLFRATRTEPLPAEGDTQRLSPPRHAPLSLGAVEALIVLAAIDVLFASFIAVQGAYFFGGLDTLARTGMTYSEYARRGFFELLAVACLALGMLYGLAFAARRETQGQNRMFNAASAVMIVLVLGLLASAFLRMWLYEQAYGFTELRLYTHSFMIWLAVVLVLFLLALLRNRPRWFTYGTVFTALAYLAVLNIANPDAMIVAENVARFEATGRIDTYYLAGLSADATPALVAVLPALPAAERSELVDMLGYQRQTLTAQLEHDGWPAWHLARARALHALQNAAIPPHGRDEDT